MPQRYEHYPKIAVVTGADSGIGKACAVALARAGFEMGTPGTAIPTAPSGRPPRSARRMRATGTGGRIINITSVHEHAPRVGSAANVTGASWPVDGGMLLMGPQAAALPNDDWRSV